MDDVDLFAKIIDLFSDATNSALIIRDLARFIGLPEHADGITIANRLNQMRTP